MIPLENTSRPEIYDFAISALIFLKLKYKYTKI